MYNPGIPGSHFQGSPEQQAAFARQALSDALVTDLEMMVDDNEDDDGRYAAGGPTNEEMAAYYHGNNHHNTIYDPEIMYHDPYGSPQLHQTDLSSSAPPHMLPPVISPNYEDHASSPITSHHDENGDYPAGDHDNSSSHHRLAPNLLQRLQHSQRSILTGGDDSRTSLDLVAALGPDGPSFLLNVLDDALPKQQEVGRVLTPKEQQQRRDQLKKTWLRIRRWLWARSDEEKLDEVRAAAYVRGPAEVTPLHLLCKLPDPPLDIVQALVHAAPDVVSWSDSHGWLPLHHACAKGADPTVLQLLLDTFAAGAIAQDKQSRTPLHFYATRPHAPDVAPETLARTAELLTTPTDRTSAAQLPDGNGMLPLHYACAYGTHTAVLKVIVMAYRDALVAKEHHGRTPMHLAMVNAHRDASPDTIRFLLSYPASKATINFRDNDGYLPLHLMTLGLKGYARAESDSEKRNNVSESLSLYLEAEPVPVADFLTAIQDLPDWLQETAVVSKHVRNVLNEKIVKRFPTAILMLDGYVFISVVICFALTSKNHIDMRFDPENTEDTTQSALSCLFIGACYFILRELLQIVSLISINSLNSWLKDFSNWLDFSVFILVIYYACIMATGGAAISNDAFRIGVAFTQGLLWVSIILFLKKTLVDFAVFVGGVVYVVRRLVAFLLSVVVILLLFGQMFYFIYVDTDICQPPTQETIDAHGGIQYSCQFAHCHFWTSCLKVYTMMMGEINFVMRYSTNLAAQLVFVLYAFVVVILLSTVLIAIVVDSYEVIQNDRAAIVFWSNRLDFVAEIDAIAYALKRRLKKGENTKKGVSGSSTNKNREAKEGPSTSQTDTVFNEETGHETSKDIFREGWHQVMSLFDASLYEDIDFCESVVYNLFRVFCIFLVIPLWLILGAITAGWLWPPQIREYLFAQRDAVASRASLERKKLDQLRDLREELNKVKAEVSRERLIGREETLRMRVEVEKMQGEILADAQQIHEVVASILVAGGC